MSSLPDSNHEPQRIKQRQAYFPKLVTNVQFDEKTNKISFRINNCSQYLTWQRKPFHEITTIDFYMYTLSRYIDKLSNDRNKTKKSGSKHRMRAIIGLDIKLYSLNSSHPNFGVMQVHQKSIGNDRTIFVKETDLYHKNEKLTLSAHIRSTVMSFNSKRTAAASLSQARIVKKQYVASKSLVINNFPFCSPSMIGDCNQKCVFLSDLMVKNNKICCDGLICLENGFDSHPWCGGTGDHINSNHVVGSCIQFIYLLIRNCKYDKFDKIMLKNENTKMLKPYHQCHLTIFNAQIQYKKFIELGQYEIELIDLSLMDDLQIKQSCIGKENVLFAFKVQLNIKQTHNICIKATFH